MERLIAPALLAVVLTATACGPGPTEAPEDVVVAGARLENIRIAELGVAAGYMWGEADLVVAGEDGSEYDWPVQIDGALLGIVGGSQTTGYQLTCEFKLPDEADLVGEELPDVDDEEVEPTDVITADHLLGTYSGWGIGMAIIYGGHARHLTNDVGVVITPSFWVRGFGILWLLEWMTISLAE